MLSWKLWHHVIFLLGFSIRAHADDDAVRLSIETNASVGNHPIEKTERRLQTVFLMDNNEVQYMGNDGFPANYFPLPHCAGDCDTDDDCQGEMVCYLRDRFQPVPGCTGGEVDSSTFDYCIFATDLQPKPPVAPTPNPTNPPTSASPTTLNPTTAMPTYVGQPPVTPAPSSCPTLGPVSTTRAPTPPPLPQIDAVGADWIPYDVFPLGLCQGHCNGDDQCEGNYICFGRLPFFPIPGCAGGEEEPWGWNYCIEQTAPPAPPSPPTERPTIPPWKQIELVGNDGLPAPVFPLQECQGDCDTDEECAGDLVCLKRGEFKAVPGCHGGENTLSGTDVCVVAPPSPATKAPAPTPGPATPANAIRIVGNRGLPYSAYPLQECEGVCQFDSDCIAGLVCHTRAGYAPVPGCTGGDLQDLPFSYCVDYWNIPTSPPVPFVPTAPAAPVAPFVVPTARPPSPPPIPQPFNEFQLRLYWEQGYRWQDSADEEFWCATYDFEGPCIYGSDDQRPCENEMYLSTCRNDPNQRHKFIELPNNEILIHLSNGGDRCYERDGRRIYALSCDASKPTQRWFAPNGNFNGYRFELSQADFPQCVSNDHHPKLGEVVEMHSCEVSRISKTSYWNKY